MKKIMSSAFQQDEGLAWAHFLQPESTCSPPSTEAEMYKVATELVALLPQLRGRDRDEVAFALSMASGLPTFSKQLVSVVYKRLFQLYITTS